MLKYSKGNINPYISMSGMWGSWWCQLSLMGFGSPIHMALICSTQGLCFVLALLNACVFPSQTLHLTHVFPLQLTLYLHGFTNWPLSLLTALS